MRPQKLLLISWSMPPSPYAMSSVIANMVQQFNSDELLLVGEKGDVHLKQSVGISHISTAFVTRKLGDRKSLTLIQLPLALIKVLYLLRKHRCTKIMACYPHEVFLLLGYLASVLSGRPLLLYFHNAYLENRNSWFKSVHRLFQQILFKRAEHVFVMSEGMVDLFARNYPALKKCSAMVHTFNEQLPEYEHSVVKDNISFYFSGNVNASCEEAAKRLFNTITSIPGCSITISPGVQKPEVEKMGINTQQINFISVNRTDLLKEMRKTDILLLPHGFSGSLSQDEYDTIFPTKTIEYLISGKPILFHGPSSSYIARFMVKNNCAYVVDSPDEKKILQAIRDLKENESLRETLVKNALKAAGMFYAPHVIADFKRKHLSLEFCKVSLAA